MSSKHISKHFKPKKAEGVALPMIIGMAILVIFLFIYLTTTTSLFKKGVKSTDDQLTQSKDSDSDGVPNLVDNCDCVPGDGKVRGCPDPYKDTDKTSSNNKCLA